MTDTIYTEPRTSESPFPNNDGEQSRVHSMRFKLNDKTKHHYMLDVDTNINKAYRYISDTLSRDAENGGNGTFSVMDVVNTLHFLDKSNLVRMNINGVDTDIIGGIGYKHFSEAIVLINNLISMNLIMIDSLEFCMVVGDEYSLKVNR